MNFVIREERIMECRLLFNFCNCFLLVFVIDICLGGGGGVGDGW